MSSRKTLQGLLSKNFSIYGGATGYLVGDGGSTSHISKVGSLSIVLGAGSLDLG